MNMRKILALGFFASLIAISQPAVAQDAEATAVGRCGVPGATPLFSRSASKLPSNWSFETVVKRTGVPLPAVIIDGWEPVRAPVSDLLRELMSEASIPITVSDSAIMATWTQQNVSLSDAVDTLVRQIGGSWSYDGKVLTVSSEPFATSTSASFALPKERDARLATIDVLRGYDVNVSADASKVTVSGTPEELTKARTALAETKGITVFDVSFLRGRPLEGRYNWNELGATTRMVDGAGGKFIFTDPDPESLIKRLVEKGDLIEESAQSVAAPVGWSVAVPPSQCGRGAGELMVSAKNNIQGLDLSFSMPGIKADYSAFPLGALALSAAPTPSDGWITMVVVRPRTVRFRLN